MKKISEFLGKPVLSLYESVTEGIVKDLVFDRTFKKLKYIVLFSDTEFQEEKIVNANDIYSYGENALIIKNKACLELKETILEETSNPINNNVYTTQGKFVGVVSDLELDEKNNIINVILNNGEILEVGQVVTSGKDAMFIQDEENKIKLYNFKKKSRINAKQAKDIKVQIFPQKEETEIVANEENVEETAPLLEANVNQTEALQDNTTADTEIAKPIKPKKKVTLNEDCLPSKKATKDNFLIGRKVQKNIYSFNHELIIKKNTRVTEKTIVTAKSHSKLKELTLYSI